MSILGNLTIVDNLAGEEDRLGGRQLFDSKIYDAKIKMAYLLAAATGSIGLTLILDLEGKEYNKTIYISNKKGETFSTDADGNKKNLMGYNLANALAMVATGKTFKALKEEERLQKIRNFKEKKDENIKVQVLVDLLDKDVKVAIIRQEVNKQVKQGEVYVSTNDKIEENDIAKFFCAKKKFLNMSATEMLEAQADDSKTAEFYLKWNEQNEGKVISRYKPVASGAASGAPKSGVTKPETATDLFGDDD